MTKNLFLLGLGVLGVAFVACDKKDDSKVQVEPEKETMAPAPTVKAPAATPAATPAPAPAATPATMPAPAAEMPAPAPAADAQPAPVAPAK